MPLTAFVDIVSDDICYMPLTVFIILFFDTTPFICL